MHIKKKSKMNMTNEQITEPAKDGKSRCMQKLEFLLNNSPLTCFEVTLDGMILFISPSIRQLSGYSDEELLNRSMWNLYKDMNDREQLIEKLMGSGQVRNYRVELKDKDDRIRLCLLDAVLLQDEWGNPVSLFGSIGIAD